MDLSITTLCKVSTILEKLKANYEDHKIIVAEAKKGFVEKMQTALEENLKALEEGTLDRLSLTLLPPPDHSDVYRTAIAMLEMTQETEIELEAYEFRNLVMDEWNWMSGFLATNANYSAYAIEVAATKGINL